MCKKESIKIERHWYNNGKINKLFKLEDNIPLDFTLGRLPHSKLHKLNISKSKLGHFVQIETRVKIKNKLKGRKLSKEVCEKLSKSHKGKFSGTHYYNNGLICVRRKNCPEGFVLGRLPMSEAQKIKIGLKNKGIVRTDIQKQKQREIHLNIELINKSFETRKRNNNYHTSKDSEDVFMTNLMTFMDRDNIERQYGDSRYPFHCDFYLKDLDLFIELNHFWTHGKHPFNKNNPEDLEVLNNWKSKSKYSKFYAGAVDTWAIKDVKKFEVALKNNLNYLVSYSKDDMFRIIEILRCNYKKFKTDILSMRDKRVSL